MSAPAPVTIVCDTREQRPLAFSSRVEVIRGTLPVGDYAPIGHETKAAIERKTLADFVQSVTRERPRFWRELEKLAGYEFRAVVLEADMICAAIGAYRSLAAPKSILASAAALTTDFGIPVIWAHDPDLAARFTEWALCRFVSKRGAAAACASSSVCAAGGTST